MDRETLKIRLRERGLSVQQLAAALGVHRATAYRWLKGESEIPPWLPVALDGLACRATPPERP